MSATKSDAITVCMAVYKNDNAAWLRESIDSILGQSYKPEQVILVIDGPISSALMSTIRSYGTKLEVVQIPENKGLWNALNVGIQHSRNELIARMDADDISVENRLAKQLEVMQQDPELGILGGQIIEFTTDSVRESPKKLQSMRSVPLGYKEIVKFSKRRSPLNHPTVMYRKSIIERLGGYSRLNRSEDYDLWMRAIQDGVKIRNIEDVLLYFRTDRAAIKRRKTIATVREHILLRGRFLRRGYISIVDYIVVCAGFAIICVAPTSVVDTLYRWFLRKGRA